MIDYKINFRRLCDKDFQNLYKWCNNRDVYQWFEQRQLSYNEIISKYSNKLNNKNQNLYIIELNGISIGLIQLYKYNNDINLDLSNRIKNIYEYDIFIGESKYINKGYGNTIINKFNYMLYKKHNVDAIIIRPFKRNVRAVKCYLKCNFKIIYEYSGFDTLGKEEKILVLINTKEKNENNRI